MSGEKILGALIGLVGAVNNNGRIDTTDAVVRRALCCLLAAERGEAVDEPAEAGAVTEEKFRVSPGCATCPSPCGNTSEYDMSRLGENPPAVRAAKRDMLEAALLLAERTAPEEPLPEKIYKAIAYVSYDMDPVVYEDLGKELELC